jgi:hypothetical protein
LTGIVVDPYGAPVAGASIRGWLTWDTYEGIGPEVVTQTDESGRYLLCGLSEAFLSRGFLYVSAPDGTQDAFHLFNKQGKPREIGNGEFALDVHVVPKPTRTALGFRVWP